MRCRIYIIPIKEWREFENVVVDQTCVKAYKKTGDRSQTGAILTHIQNVVIELL